MPCFTEYRDIFGKPGEGVHAYRFAGVAIVDYILAIILAMFISKVSGYASRTGPFKGRVSEMPLVITTIMVMFLGIIMHSAVGISTGATRFLGLDRCK